jgi:hypothetical protein
MHTPSRHGCDDDFPTATVVYPTMHGHDRSGFSPTATRLGAALLGYLLAVTLLLTLLPF